MTYFPPLDQCLNGKQPVISWTTVLEELLLDLETTEEPEIQNFLTDETVVSTLITSLNPFSGRSEQTKRDYDTRTAPIQIASSSGAYNLEQIKSDALWLAKEVDINEVAALRLVIVEWQTRSADLLLGRVFDENEHKRGSKTELNDVVRHRRLLQIFLHERSAVKHICSILVALDADRTNASTITYDLRILQVAAKIRNTRSNKEAVGQDDFTTKVIKNVKQQTQYLEDAQTWPGSFRSDFSLHADFTTAVLRDMASDLRQCIVHNFHDQGIPSADTVLSWFNLMQEINFLQDLNPPPEQVVLSELVQCLVSMFSASILNLPETISEIDQLYQQDQDIAYPRLAAKPYIADDACVKELNLIFFQAAEAESRIAGPSIYAWSIITMYIRDLARADAHLIEESDHSTTRKSSLIEQKFDVLQDMALGTARDDPPQYLARQAADNVDVFAVIADLSRIVSSAFSAGIELPVAHTCRIILFDLVRESLPTVTYDEHIIEAILAIISPDSSRPYPALALKFWRDQTRCYPLVYHQALARYPYELSPLLRLLAALTGNLTAASDDWNGIVDSFESLSSITMILPDAFRGYTLEHEEDGANAFRLLEALPIFSETQSLRSFGNDTTDQQTALNIPEDTHGTILKDSRPFIVSLKHYHSGLHYVGLLLTTLLPNSRYSLASPASPIDNFIAADIVQLTVNLLVGASDRSSAEHIMTELGASISGDLDSTAVICDVLEMEFIARVEQSSQPGSTELMLQCVKYLRVISEHFPERLWSYLSQSSLLNSANGSNAILMFSTSSEDFIKQSRLLHECLKLYDTAIDDAIQGLVKRRKTTPTARNGSRFDSPMESLGDISERVITQTLVAFTTFAVELLRNVTASNEIDQKSKSQIVTIITSVFKRLLVCVYGVGEDITTSPMKILAPATQIIITSLLSEDISTQTLSPILSPLLQLVQMSRFPQSDQKIALIAEAKSSLDLLLTALRVSRSLQKHDLKLATFLVSVMHIFAALFAAQAPLQGYVAEILTEMITILSTHSQEPISIFSQLPPQQGAYFLMNLTTFDSSFISVTTECKIWTLFATACKYGQQWFAIYLLTGSLPSEQIKQKSEGRSSILNHALQALSDLRNIQPERAAALLQFIAEAQKKRDWVTSLIRQDVHFLSNALTWLNEIQPYSRGANIAGTLLSAREYRIAALLCDILAVNIHSSLEIGDKSLTKQLSSKTSFLTQHAMRADGYNINLHSKLAANLANRFDGLSLQNLKRTTVNPGVFGAQFVYDSKVARHLLQHDESWKGSGRARAQGFVDEFEKANINLSLYDAQCRLVRGWKILAITLADGNESNESEHLTDCIEAGLSASADTNLQDPEAAGLLQSRAELVFTLLSKLTKKICSKHQTDRILQSVWSLLRTSPVDYDVAEVEADLTYYRTLLQILFMCLTISNAANDRLESAPQDGALMRIDFDKDTTLVEIMTKTITTGFRALCANLHDSTDCARPEDFALLIALAKAVLSASSDRHFYNQIADAVAFSGVLRSTASLFSWSDRLADLTNGEPVYGEMALMFLSTLSRVPQIAEQMAVDNILNQLSSANLSNYFRKPGGKGPFDEPTRMFVIWTDGLLPLCLNLIEAVGPPIISEISSLFSSFPQQLARAEKSLQNATPSARNPRAGAVTLGLVTEARDLTMIAQILKSAVQLGAAEGIISADIEELSYDVKLVNEDVEALMKSPRSLRERVLAATARDVALLNDRTKGDTDNALQAAIQRELLVTLAMVKE